MSDSIRLSHRAVAASALAVVLTGGALVPAAAGEGDEGGRGDRGRSEQARGKRDGRGPSRGDGQAQAQSHESHQFPESRRQGSPSPKPGHGGDKGGKGGKGGSGGAAQDPAGNNGTFKVDGPAYDTGMDNEPHVTCAFRLLFFGFDEGQTGDITIAGHAPSGSGVVDSRTGVLLSDDPAGGGPNDPDAVVSYSLSDLDLAGLTAHDKHGYHLKVTVETGEPGGVKHKVFWLEPCDTAAGATGEEDDSSGSDTRGNGLGRNGGSGGAEVGAVGQERLDRSEVLGTKLTREGSTNRGADVLGVSMAQGPLAYTGSMTEKLLALGASLLAMGMLFVTLASRRPRGKHAL